jgi:hypothetical protein
MMAPGHGKPFVSNKQDLEDLKPRLAKQKEYFSSVIADPDCNFGLNPSWVRIYPYQLRAKAGSTASLELRVRNYRSKPMRLEATLMVPSSWKSLPERLTVEAPPYADSGGGFTVSIPENWDPSRSRVAVAADVVADGRYLGEIAEGIVDLVPVDSKAGRALKYRTK